MFRTSIFLATAFGILMMGSANAPASAASLQVFSAHKELMPAHLHPVTSPGKTMYRPPSKKKPL